MESIADKRKELLSKIGGVLNADINVATALLFYFPDEPVDYLAEFWINVRDAVVNDYEIQCTKIFGGKED